MPNSEQEYNGRPTTIEVDLDAIRHNFQQLKSLVGAARLMPVVKGNAYGHGLERVALELVDAGASYLGVAYLEEAITLRRTFRKAGVDAAILTLTGMCGRQAREYIEYDVDILVSSELKIRQIEQAAKDVGTRARIHLKIDTGMERNGTHYYSAQKFLRAASECVHCDIVGICSHFATSEWEDTSFAATQLNRFLECVSEFEAISNQRPLRHIANSAAILQLPESRLDMVRPGLAIYGVSPAPHLTSVLPLRRALRLRSEIVYFKVVRKDAGVSYGLKWRAPQDTRVVTLPIGYGDGYSRALSNKAEVLVGGKRCPVVGTVCMDQIMANIDDGEGRNGDEAVLIGRQEAEEITAEELAEKVGTDAREILCALRARIPRRYFRDGELLV